MSLASDSKGNSIYVRDIAKTAEQLSKWQDIKLAEPYRYSATTDQNSEFPLGVIVGLNDQISKNLKENLKQSSKGQSTSELNKVKSEDFDNTSRWINYSRIVANNMRPLSHLTLLDTGETINQLGQTIENLNNNAARKLNNPPNSSNLTIRDPWLKLKLNSNLFTHNSSGDIIAKEINPFETQQETSNPSSWSKFKTRASKFMNNKYTQMGMQALGIGMNFLGDNDKDINSWDTATKQLRNGIADSMFASGNPWLMLAGLSVKGFGKLGAFGDSTKGLGAGNDVLNTIGSFVPGVGWISGKSKEIQKDENVLASSSFTGVANDVNNAAQNAGGKFLFGMDKANRRIDRANLAQNQASQILDDNRLAKQSSNHPLYQMRTQMLTSGGYNPTSTYAKMGAKLYNIEEAKRILNNRLQSFKNGGAVNVIPDGALHKNRHHLEDIDEKFEDVTTKGIPVITEAKNGDIIQQAEVEKEEIIFNLAVTKKLEELMEKGTDEAAIEAGKLLTEEILRNTIDNTNKLL